MRSAGVARGSGVAYEFTLLDMSGREGNGLGGVLACGAGVRKGLGVLKPDTVKRAQMSHRDGEAAVVGCEYNVVAIAAELAIIDSIGLAELYSAVGGSIYRSARGRFVVAVLTIGRARGTSGKTTLEGGVETIGAFDLIVVSTRYKGQFVTTRAAWRVVDDILVGRGADAIDFVAICRVAPRTAQVVSVSRNVGLGLE